MTTLDTVIKFVVGQSVVTATMLMVSKETGKLVPAINAMPVAYSPIALEVGDVIECKPHSIRPFRIVRDGIEIWSDS